ncbi:glycosyl transferase family group 2-domain-containing protein [Dichomitus squalens]|uniref:Glycosyl transferase family group 2-domain-containing protein n=1 Tax=Dichomitus squalens TaxID=114155 RepID=A0A4Q9PWA8_9APHY|nr:glycosyl transferase family group 2-domain-containing protein [Dichomitus squalens]TBU58937.1 glycosyl transferase family group 2-domain-containing protein [Dichomitus squalens]
MDYDAYDALLHHIFKQTQGDAWFKPSEENIHAGVCLRVDNNNFRVFPYENEYLEPFEVAIRVLNPVVAVKVRSAAIHAALGTVKEDADCIYVDTDTRIQIMVSMAFLPRADKEQCAAFIRDERVMVVWTYDLDSIIPTCRDFEEKLIKLVWTRRSAFASLASSAAPSTVASNVNLTEKTVEATSEKPGAVVPAPKELKAPKKRGCNIFGYWKANASDVEKTADGPSPRPMRMFAPVYCGLGAGLSLFFIGSGVSVLLEESLLDGYWPRFALLVTVPFLFCVSLFFSLMIVTNITYVIGPVAQFHENSKYYSAVPPAPNKLVDENLPHMTIEMPVYKESLTETIAPSVYSLKKAMQTYARQGGTSSIFVHDDGLQLISEEERQARISFYADHNIGWVARPPHSSAPDGYKRAGRFKKASNMNYGLALSLKMEKHILELEAAAAAANGGDDFEDNIEERALEMAIEETYEESGRKWRPWACNAKSLRVGEIILIVDSDTIVPEDCLRDAARELAECPEVAIIQHESDVMQVAHHYFENGITHFTRRINRCISMCCANGEVAPFVGHNAFLRWSALQDAAFIDEADGKKKIWSESNVSEDFDMALRLMLRGFVMRWATYSNRGFKEGVSLTCDDELNRWQKYSYGCNELIFNPLVQWWYKGPITKQLRTFMWSDAPIHYKIGMMSYMFSYYALSGAFVLSTMNYFLLGWNLPIDDYYEHSFEIWLACTVVFPGAGNLGFTMLEYRLGSRSLLDAVVENLTWIPFFFFFFGGLSLHLSQALLAHLFSYNITWGATKKEVERSNFWQEVPKILKRFWIAFAFSFIMIFVMIILTTDVVPIGWRIFGWDWAVIVPVAIVVGCHVLYPILLNPWLMIFSY